MTGDNQYVTQKIAHDVGLDADRILIGNQVDTMDDAALAHQAENGAIFARVSPEQKNRVILALRPAGTSLATWVMESKRCSVAAHCGCWDFRHEWSECGQGRSQDHPAGKDLAVVNDGVLEGRRSFANIMKYIIMGTSSNFGNMFSMAAASLFLPFLPMLPSQILLNNSSMTSRRSASQLTMLISP